MWPSSPSHLSVLAPPSLARNKLAHRALSNVLGSTHPFRLCPGPLDLSYRRTDRGRTLAGSRASQACSTFASQTSASDSARSRYHVPLLSDAAGYWYGVAMVLSSMRSGPLLRLCKGLLRPSTALH